MPGLDGTGPEGTGAGTGRGLGPCGAGSRRGRLGGRIGRAGRGPAGACQCPSCGQTVGHIRGIPCFTRSCPKCGTRMRRA